jgi:DNA-binding PadR family transcriptional regulator
VSRINNVRGSVVGKDTLGEFEHHVLLATLRLRGEGFSTSIVLELEERIGRSVAPAAVYIALRRLEEKRLVRSRMELAEGDPDPRTRRYFHVTERGELKLLEARRRFHSLWEGLELLEEEV